MAKGDKSGETKPVKRGESSACAGSKPRVRDRIFDTACDLFYRQGIRSVGVDTIASEAGTNKMSFYRNFSSKDDLISEYLQKEADEFFANWDATMAAHAGNPRRQIEALIESQVEKILHGTDCHGCAFMNAAVELRDTDHPARTIIMSSKAETLRRLRKLAREAGARTPDLLADALALIANGNMMSWISYPEEEWPGRQSVKIVRKLLQAFID